MIEYFPKICVTAVQLGRGEENKRGENVETMTGLICDLKSGLPEALEKSASYWIKKIEEDLGLNAHGSKLFDELMGPFKEELVSLIESAVSAFGGSGPRPKVLADGALGDAG
eukprot:949396-Pyramimonas_sp.AAC.1